MHLLKHSPITVELARQALRDKIKTSDQDDSRQFDVPKLPPQFKQQWHMNGELPLRHYAQRLELSS